MTDSHTDDQSHARICMCDRFPRGICRIIDSYIYDSHMNVVVELRGWQSRIIISDVFHESVVISNLHARDFKRLLPSAHVVGFCCLQSEGKAMEFAHATKSNPLADAVIFEYIDQGIKNWEEFGQFFVMEFPSARALVLEQNYTSDYGCSVETDIARFLSFVRATRLRLFILVDLQSRFLDKIEMSDILHAQPDDSHFVILAYDLYNKLGNKSRLLADKKRNATLQICVTKCCTFGPPADNSV